MPRKPLRWAAAKEVDLQGLDHLAAFTARLHACTPTRACAWPSPRRNRQRSNQDNAGPPKCC